MLKYIKSILIYYHSVICMCVFSHKQSLWVHAYIDSISSIIQIWLKVTNKEYLKSFVSLTDSHLYVNRNE